MSSGGRRLHLPDEEEHPAASQKPDVKMNDQRSKLYAVDLSFVSPVYRGEALVEDLVNEIRNNASLAGLSFEIILVEDGSPDASWQAIERAADTYPEVIGIKLSRNFGQHYAITAGLAQCRGEWVVVLDCDLQDRPDQFARLYEQTQHGYKVILARRVERTDNWLKRLSSRIFYKVFGYLTDTKQDASIANYGIYHASVVRSILAMKDKIRYFPTMSQWVGFPTIAVDVEHGSRNSGKSSYTLRSLFRLASNNIIAFSDKPLRLTIFFGFWISLISAIFGVVMLARYLMGQVTVLGYTSLIISIWFIGGLIMFVLGVIGLYIGKAYDQVKDRPTYIIEDIVVHGKD